MANHGHGYIPFFPGASAHNVWQTPLPGHVGWTQGGDNAVTIPGNWAKTDAGDTGPEANTYAVAGQEGIGAQGVKVTAVGTAAGLIYTFPTALDFSTGGSFSLWYNISTQACTGIQMYLWDDAGLYSSPVTLDPATGWHSAADYMVTEFKADGGGGAIDYTAIKKIVVSMITCTEGAVLTIDKLQWVLPDAKPKARVLFRFDDGLASHFTTAVPLLDAKGWKGLFGCMADRVAQATAGETGYSAYATAGAIISAVNGGHMAAVHGPALTGSDAQNLVELRKSRRTLMSFGCGGPGMDVFITPGGSTIGQGFYDGIEAQGIRQIYPQGKNDGFLIGTCGGLGAGADTGMGLTPCVPLSRFAIHGGKYDNAADNTGILYGATWAGGAGASALTAVPVIDNAITYGAMAPLLFHNLTGAGYVTAASLGYLIDYIAAKQAAGLLEVVNPLDLLPNKVLAG